MQRGAAEEDEEMAKAAQWAIDAARKVARDELRTGHGVRCTDADLELDEYSFDVFCPVTGAVIAYIGVTECGADFVPA